MTTQLLSAVWDQEASRLRQRVEELIVFSTLVAFSIISLIPHQALAFSQHAEAPWHPMVFEYPQGQLRHILSSDGIFPSPRQLNLKEGMVISVLASGYSSTVEQTDASPFITASGTHVRDGVVAANFLPLGTRLMWGNKLLVVEDRLNPRYNDVYRIDIWMPSTDEAITFGVRLVTVQILALPE